MDSDKKSKQSERVAHAGDAGRAFKQSENEFADSELSTENSSVVEVKGGESGFDEAPFSKYSNGVGGERRENVIYATRILTALNPSWKPSKGGLTKSEGRSTEVQKTPVPSLPPVPPKSVEPVQAKAPNESLLKDGIPKISFSSGPSISQNGFLLSSGMLPTVDIDKSFDMPVIAEEFWGDDSSLGAALDTDELERASRSGEQGVLTNSSIEFSVLDDEEDGVHASSGIGKAKSGLAAAELKDAARSEKEGSSAGKGAVNAGGGKPPALSFGKPGPGQIGLFPKDGVKVGEEKEAAEREKSNEAVRVKAVSKVGKGNGTLEDGREGTSGMFSNVSLGSGKDKEKEPEKAASPKRAQINLPKVSVPDVSEGATKLKHPLEPSKIDNPIIPDDRTKTHIFETVLDENGEKVEQGEVFATKFMRNGSKISTNARVVNDLYPDKHAPSLLSPGVSAGAQLHPDDLASERRSMSNVDFVYDHLFMRDNRNILGFPLDCLGREDTIDGVFTEIVRSGGSENPCVFRIRSDYRFEEELFIDYILESCRDHLGGAFYATCDVDIREDESSCLRTLLASRIGIFNTYSDEVKTEHIINAATELFEAKDSTRAQNILFYAFGLSELVDKSNIENYGENLDHKLFELFLKAVARDASKGPVLIFLTHTDQRQYDGWREVVSQLKRLHASNVCVFVCGDASFEVEATETIELGPVPGDAISRYVSQVLKRYKTVPPNFANTIVSQSEGSFTRLWYIFKTLEVRGVFSTDRAQPVIVDDGSLAQLQGSFNDLVMAHFGALTQEQSYLVTVASILGTPFKIDDISVVLALDPLPNEIPWFHDLRHRWTERIVQELVELGEIQRLHDEDTGLTRYMLSDMTGMRLLAQSLDATFSKAIHGCYAQLLLQHNPSDPQIGIHFEEAGMWSEAAQVWLKLAVRRRSDFYNITSLHLLNNCLRYIAPQHGEIFVSLQHELALLASRFGQFQTAQEHYNAMLRVAQLTRDPSGSVEAFIGLAMSLLRQGIHNDARDLLLFGLDLAERINDQKLVSDSYLGLAEIVFRTGSKGAFVGAMRYVERAIELYRSFGDLPSLAKTLGLSAEIYVVRGDLTRAKSALSEAYQAFKASGYWYEMPPVLAVLADVEMQQKNFVEAAKYIQEGMEIVEKTDDVCDIFNLTELRAKLNIILNRRDAVRVDIASLQSICAEHSFTPWNVRLRLLIAQFDFSRKSFQKTTKALSAFFDIATQLKNNLYLSRGYALSAQLNYEVFQLKVGQVSIEKTEKLFMTANSLFESIGAWHELAENQRRYADFLSLMNRPFEAVQFRERADRVDPFCQ